MLQKKLLIAIVNLAKINLTKVNLTSASLTITCLALATGHVFATESSGATEAAGSLSSNTVSATSTLPESLTLRSAIERSLANNQALAVLRTQAESLDAVPSQAGALPDPTLGLNALNLPTDTFDLDQEPMTQMQISLSQSFPFPGKRGLKREAAEFEASAAANKVLDKQLEIIAGVRGTWWRLIYLDRAIEIIHQNQGLMRDFVQIAQTKYKVGKGLQQDVLLAQLELSRLLNRLIPLQGMQHAVEARPLLDVERERMEAARTRLDLAKKQYYPDFKLGAAYGFRDATDPTGRNLPDLASFRLSINLPIFSASKQSKAVDQRSSDYFQRKHAFNNSLRGVQAAIARNHTQYQSAREQVSLYGTAIIPQAQQTVAAMLSAYQVNQVDFLNVLNAQIMLYNARISYWEALSNAKQSLANLAASVGSEDLYE